MKKKSLFIFLMVAFLTPCNSKAIGRQCVILLHGLGRSHYSMSSLAFSLQQHHYIVVNEDYPSTQKPIKDLANQYIPLMIHQCLLNHVDHINFVTHSLGGIVLRAYLQKHKIPTLLRIVMLGPPNHGSKLADFLQNNWLFKFLGGPGGQELTTAKTSTPNKLHLNHPYQIGIIAGSFSLTPFNSFIFHESNDGKVSISSTRMSKMKDFIILPVSHKFMMDNFLVQKQILSFLERGTFIH